MSCRPDPFRTPMFAVVLAISTLATCTPVPPSEPEAPGDGGTRTASAPATGPLPVIEHALVPPPQVPPPVNRDHSAKVVVKLEVREVVKEISKGATYTFWTYGGSVPGPMIRVRKGDTVEFHLMNHPDNKMPHNIDLHAVTGPGGGATSTFSAPGHASQFTFQALNEGVYVYHCATAPVGMHIGNGMYGLIAVEPERGWPEVDREFYVMQGDFYTTGDYREPGHQPFDIERAIDEDPSYVLFNGMDGALVGDRALQAKVGETVRMFVGNGGPNLTSSFHVIGEIFDSVYTEGGSLAQLNVQTTSIPAGGSAMTDFKVDVPGTFILVDHALFRAFNKGAIGMLNVQGDEDKSIYSGRQVDEVYLADVSPEAVALREGVPSDDTSLSARRTRGQATFMGICSTCHMPDGKGVPEVFPPLAGSDFLMSDKRRSIEIVLKGLNGPIAVSGKPYNGVMPPMANLTDHEIADVLSYVRNALGNAGEMVTEAEVAEVREALVQPEKKGHP